MNKNLFPNLTKTITYVKADDNGFPLAYCGVSSIDNEDWNVSTYMLKADEVPEILMDAKTTAEYVAKLINKDLNNPKGIWNE